MSGSQSDLVVGVAGHIDHGKTSLVRALTGVDTDRLPEEKSRGITIELGFAPLPLPDGRHAAVVDMPGHERFVRTMIAGAGGVDLMLLVVAANEGVMPQTREHLAIAELVGVRAGVCALSKSDLAGRDIVDLALEEVREVLAGTVLAGVEVIPVSAVTGDGLDALRAALCRVKVAARDTRGPCLMAIDRVFVRKGFGVVVTGTLVSGRVSESQVLHIGPCGADEGTREVRVRGLQVHGRSVSEARAGTRLAVNLAGVELAEVPRGAWLFRDGEVCLTKAFDAEVTLLPQTRKALGRRAKLEVSVGTTHAQAKVALLDGDALEPGRAALARVTTDRPLLVRPGERMVLRGPPSLAGVGSTVGGAVAVRPMTERLRRRSVALDRARRCLGASPTAHAAVELEVAGGAGLTRAQLRARSGYVVSDASAADGVIALGGERCVGESVVTTLENTVLAELSAHHTKHPAERGLDRRALAAHGDDALIDLVIGRLIATRRAARDGDVVARAGWKARGADDVPYLAQVRASVARAGTSALRVAEMATAMATDAKTIEVALKRLVARGDVVKVSEELWVDAPAMGQLEAKLVAWLTEHGTIDAQGFKELSGLSRKYAIPYAEFFDAKKVTLRLGDVRKLRGK